MLDINSAQTLNSKTKMPVLGLGVWQIPDGQPTIQAVSWALQAGYRHIDTAKLYKNEAGVGQAIRNSGIPRKDIWITTKLWGSDQLSAEKAFEASLQRLGLDYIDLYLVHWPIPGLIKRTWRQMEQIYASSRCKAIGVSNYSIHQLQEMLAGTGVPPAVNQVKCSPFHFDQALYDFCRNHMIAFEAYSPLTRGNQLENPTLVSLAHKHGKSPAQVLIRWTLQKDMIVIPKSAQQKHIQQNADVFDFELTKEDMATLDSLSL